MKPASFCRARSSLTTEAGSSAGSSPLQTNRAMPMVDCIERQR
jgi:hypothetical protein